MRELRKQYRDADCPITLTVTHDQKRHHTVISAHRAIGKPYLGMVGVVSTTCTQDNHIHIQVLMRLQKLMCT